MSKKNLMIIIISALCLISLAGAGEKENKIEPKLVYEKRFDFEIEQGKIGEDGSLFPTIFVTKDRRVLFTDNRGNKKKTYRLSNNHKIFFSEDGKYVGIVYYPDRWWEVGITIDLYNNKGDKISRIDLKDNLEPILIIGKNANYIVVQKLGMDELEGIDFYSQEGRLVKSYSAIIPHKVGDITVNIYLTGIGCYIPYSELPIISSPGVAGDFLLCRAYSSPYDGTWLLVFKIDGELLLIKKMYGDAIPNFPTISNDGNYIIYNRYTPYDLVEKRGLTDNWAWETIKIYNSRNGITKEVGVTIPPSEKSKAPIIMDFTEDSKSFWIIHRNKFYFGDAEKGKIEYSWETQDTALIVYAFTSLHGNYALCILADGRIVVLNNRGKVIYEGCPSESKILDAKFDEVRQEIIILSEKGIFKYTLVR